MTTNINDNQVRKCALPECNVTFIVRPEVYWQKCCTKKHAEILRKRRYRIRVTQALELLNRSTMGDNQQ